MEAISLQSGSNGNCICVRANGVKLLFDAGISGSRAAERLALHGRDITRVDALLISHDHSDHARSAGIFQRKFGVPILATSATFDTAAEKYRLGDVRDVRHFKAGEVLRFGKVSVETIPTAHDSPDGVAFVVDDGTSRLGILTDLGHVFDGLEGVIASLDAVFIESNYDPDMLEHGPYPASIKRRIVGDGGHHSNIEAAELLHAYAGERLKWACLAHLSEDNNTPALALRTHRRIVGKALPLYVASRYEATHVLEV